VGIKGGTGGSHVDQIRKGRRQKRGKDNIFFPGLGGGGGARWGRGRGVGGGVRSEAGEVGGSSRGVGEGGKGVLLIPPGG